MSISNPLRDILSVGNGYLRGYSPQASVHSRGLVWSHSTEGFLDGKVIPMLLAYDNLSRDAPEGSGMFRHVTQEELGSILDEDAQRFMIVRPAMFDPRNDRSIDYGIVRGTTFADLKNGVGSLSIPEYPGIVQTAVEIPRIVLLDAYLKLRDALQKVALVEQCIVDGRLPDYSGFF